MPQDEALFPLVPKGALTRFSNWFEEAQKSELNDPNAMTVASVSSSGMPSARIVLMKDFDEKGWVFYTNLTSRKGQEILAGGKASILFHWKSLGRQVRVDGFVKQVADDEADDYFATRPRGSQLGAWASLQSSPMISRKDLESRLKVLEEKYDGTPVPRPPHWSGLRISPHHIEFWRDQSSRLHIRETLTYHPETGDWHESLLYP